MWINNLIARGQEPYCHVEICHNIITPNISLVARRSRWNSGDYVEDDHTVDVNMKLICFVICYKESKILW